MFDDLNCIKSNNQHFKRYFHLSTASEKLTRKGSKHEQPEIRRMQIIEAAMVCFGEHGYNTTTIDTIGKQAKLSKGSIYRFFSSKDELMLAIIEYISDEFDKRFESETVGQSNLEQLETFCKISIEDIIEHKELADLWFQIINLDFARDAITQLFKKDLAIITSIVTSGIVAGEFRESAKDTVPDAMMAMMNGSFLLSHILNQEEEEWLEKFQRSWQIIKSQLIES